MLKKKDDGKESVEAARIGFFKRLGIIYALNLVRSEVSLCLERRTPPRPITSGLIMPSSPPFITPKSKVSENT